MANAKITKDMKIGDLVQEYPEATEILLDEGVHCVGCGAAFFETLEQGLQGHGKTDEEIAAVIKKMNESIVEDTSSKDSITVTKGAVKKFKELIKEESKESKITVVGVRIGLHTHEGCHCGGKFTLDFEEKKSKNDEVIEIEGLKFLIDKDILDKVKGVKIEFMNGPEGEGFAITEPHKKKDDHDHEAGCGDSCGC
jgi:iron-sulfur cluster assembly protein